VLLAHRRGIPVAVVNGRITPQTIGRYSLVSPLTRYVLRAVDLFAMQSDHYADLITMLGADPAKVHVTGSMKYDNVSTDDHPDADLARTLGIEASAPVIVGGCTYAGEDEALIDAYRGLLPRKPDLRLILAPRHPERLAAVEAAIVGAGLRCVRRSSLHPDRPAAENTTDAVVLIDTVGELERVYSLATVAFVGGSLIPRGGHNMMEPAGRGKPVLVGPHTGNFADTVADLSGAGGLLVVGDSVELSQQLAELVRDPVRAAEMGARARRAIIEHKGATQRTTDLLLALATSRR
jgi:3-deoxy-D-manno-octulosonic-acid transferase